MRWSKKLEAGSIDIEKFQPQHTILLPNMEMDSDVNSKMSSHDVDDKDDDEALLKAQTTELVGEPDSQHTLVMAPQYLELERSEVDGHPAGTQVVKLNANGQLVSSEMIQHVGAIDGDQHGLVVHVLPPSHSDLKDGTTYYAPAATAQQLQRAGALLSEERFLTDQLTTQHYEDDLLGHDLTDDDRRLAAALMAVQYSQQQKQQQNIAKLLEPGGIVSEGNVIMSVSDTMQSLITTNQLGKVVSDPSQGSMSDMVVEYIQQVEGTSSDRKQMRLVAYHTDGQTSHTTDGAQLQAIDASQLHTHELKTISHTTAKKIVPSQMSPRARYKRSLEEGHGDMMSGVRESAESAREAIAQRAAGKIEDEEEEFDTEDDLNDSDYDVESGNRSSRRSLPHKKRIPRKLKNVKKTPGQEKIFKCIKCDETFQTQNALTTHKQLHKNNKLLFNCEICGKPSPNQLQFFEHLKSHYEPPKNIPIMDGVILQGSCVKDELHQSISQVLPPALPPPLACTHCGKIFRSQKALEKHVSTAHGQVEEVLDEEMDDDDDDMGDTTELLPEEMEDESLKKEGEWFTHHELTAVPVQHVIEQVEDHKLVEHVDDHHVLTEIAVSELQPVMEEITTDHLCDHCGENFELKSQLTLHMREEHPGAKRKTRAGKKESVLPESGTATTAAAAGEKVNRKWEQLTCPTCGRMFNHRNSLVYHLRSHTGERPHQCEVCGKSFFAASALKVHMRLHSGDKPYKCELCGRHFRQWGDLKYHCISIHTDEKQYQCEYCGKDFARKYSLIVHRRIHTGEKNYKCEFCNKTFRASSYLQNHRRIHTGEKPHPCDVCGKPFRVRSDMKRHMQTHTREGGGSSNHHHHQTAAAAAHAAALSQSSQSSSQGATELPDLDPVAAEITIQDGDREEAAAASAALAQEQDAPQQITEVAGEEVQEEVLQQYSRDPLETVRDGTGSTLYVWPIYMA